MILPLQQLRENLEECRTESDALSLLVSCKIPEAFVSIHDPGGVYTQISDTVMDLTGYSDRDLVGNSAYDHIHPADFQAILKSLATISIRPEVSEVNYRLKKADGTYVRVTSLSRQIPISRGREIIVVLTFG